MDEELNQGTQETQNESQESQESQDQTQSTEQQPVANVDERDEEIRLLRQVAQNSVRQTQTLQQQLNDINNRLTPRPQEAEITDDDFRESPAKAMETLLERKLSKLMAPINAEAENVRRERTFNSTFTQAIQSIDPSLVEYQEVLAPAVRQMLQGVEVTPQAIQFATLAALGQMSISSRKNPSPANTPKQENSPAPKTPSMPANAPSRVNPNMNKPKAPQLTEAQRKTMKKLGFEQGQEQEFINYLNADEVSFQ